MLKKFIVLILLLLAVSPTLYAQELGSASGKGTIERFLPSGDSSEQVPFAPRYSFAYSDPSKATWLIFTEVKPPLEDWLKAKDPAEARRLWCEKEKASFVALKLDSKWAVDLFFLCPGNGFVNTEMLSTINGLDSVIVAFDIRTNTQLKGNLRGGEGNCPGADGKDAYCTAKHNFTFDAPLLK